MYIDVYYAMLYAHFSLAQAMRDPVTYGFILDVDILNILHHLFRTVAYNVNSASKIHLAHLYRKSWSLLHFKVN